MRTFFGLLGSIVEEPGEVEELIFRLKGQKPKIINFKTLKNGSNERRIENLLEQYKCYFL
jgi:hypothetical protein